MVDTQNAYNKYLNLMPDFHKMHNAKQAGLGAHENETSCCSLAFQGSMRVFSHGMPGYDISGNGHHGPDYVGAASTRNGKGVQSISTEMTNGRVA